MAGLMGIDLNGVRDVLARCDGAAEEPESVDLGVRSGFIRLSSRADEVWLGGAQTVSAQHGRGSAWGMIGVAENRIGSLDLLQEVRDGDPGDPTRRALSSAMPRLLGETDAAVVAVPDVLAYDEAFRDRLLALLRRVDGLRPLLLWRPVAALLGWIEANPREALPNRRVAILSLMEDGVHLSVLSLKQEFHDRVRVLVPERSRPGQIAGASFRGRVLIEDAQGQLARETGLSTSEVETVALSPWRFAVGAKPQPELARLSSGGGWRKLPPLDYCCPRPDERDLSADFLEPLRTADLLLVEGPLAGNKTWRDGVLKALNAHQRSRFALYYDAVARGCLAAATRRRLGQPIYFDFLPQLQINAMVGESPEFVDLIARGARCRGGESFRAGAPGDYAINKGAKELDLWLFKEDFERGRKACVKLPAAADRWYPLRVSVEQVPGQGFAEVRISSPDFDALRRSPITLDWVGMEETDQTREEILEELRRQLQKGLSLPETKVEQGHPFLWSKKHPTGSLLAQLAAWRAMPLVRGNRINPDASKMLKCLHTRFSRADNPSLLGRKLEPQVQIAEPGRYRALNSDGTLPEPKSGIRVPDGADEELYLTLAKLDRDFADLKRHLKEPGATTVLNDLVGFASWCFWRCPPGIADALLGTYEGTHAYDIQHTRLRHGVARVARDANLKRYFRAVERRLAKLARLTEPEYAGIARVLRTSDEAAGLLNHALANRIVEETVRKLTRENRKTSATAYKRGFRTTLLMLAALLRHRKEHPTFLDADVEHAARKLLSTLDKAERRNLHFAGTAGTAAGVRRMRNNAEIIAELKRFIRREGRDPNIIVRIDALEDDLDDDEGQ